MTRAGALAGFFTGASVFTLLKAGAVPVSLLAATPLDFATSWLGAQQVSPYACAAIGQIAAALVTVVVSLRSEPLPHDHLERVFGSDEDRVSAPRVAGESE